MALAALGVSFYLTWVTWNQSAIAGCSGGSLADCDEVLSSVWSKWLGVPVSLFGLGVYTLILALCWPGVLRPGSWAATGLMALALLAAGSGVWFFGVQVFLLGHFCLYCLTVHVCGLLITIATYFALFSSRSSQNYDQMRALLGVESDLTDTGAPMGVAGYQPIIAVGLAAVGLLMLIVGQSFFAPLGMQFIANSPQQSISESNDTQLSAEEENASADVNAEDVPAFTLEITEESDETESTELDQPDQEQTQSSERRYVSLQSLGNRVEVTNEPTLGDPHAEQVIVELLDYTCPHCRKMHSFVHQAAERYGEDICFVIYHVPLSRHCNPYVKIEQSLHRTACDYAKLAISVWKLNPKKFPEFHNWLMEGEKAPAVYKARQKAMELVGDQVLLDKSLGVEANRRVTQHVEEMKKLNSGLPILVSEKGIIRGIPGSEKEWFGFFEDTLGLEPQSTEAK